MRKILSLSATTGTPTATTAFDGRPRVGRAAAGIQVGC